MRNITSLDSLDRFTQAYMVCALWSTTVCDESGQNIESLDDRFGLDDLAQKTVQQMTEDCALFQKEYSALLAQARDDERNGHDFWLTRNHHGAGFWDRGYPHDVGNALTKAAHAEGERDLYIGDDEKIHEA